MPISTIKDTYILNLYLMNKETRYVVYIKVLDKI